MSELIPVKCEICFEHIAYCDLDKFDVPMLGSMFSSPLPERLVPSPFNPALEWEHMNCPWCMRRPFKYRHKFMSTDGKYYGHVHECKHGCGAAFPTASQLYGHEGWHAREEKKKQREVAENA